MKRFTLTTIFSVLLMGVLVSGCSNNENENTDNINNVEQNENTNQVQDESNNDEIEENTNINGNNNEEEENSSDNGQDIDLTAEIENDEQLLGGQVYDSNGTIVGTLIIESDISEDEAVTIAEGYAERIKEKYPDMPVNVQAVQDGNNVADINLD